MRCTQRRNRRRRASKTHAEGRVEGMFVCLLDHCKQEARNGVRSGWFMRSEEDGEDILQQEETQCRKERPR